MASYLIDFENVGNEGLRGIELLEKEDAVHIFPCGVIITGLQGFEP